MYQIELTQSQISISLIIRNFLRSMSIFGYSGFTGFGKPRQEEEKKSEQSTSSQPKISNLNMFEIGAPINNSMGGQKKLPQNKLPLSNVSTFDVHKTGFQSQPPSSKLGPPQKQQPKQDSSNNMFNAHSKQKNISINNNPFLVKQDSKMGIGESNYQKQTAQIIPKQQYPSLNKQTQNQKVENPFMRKAPHEQNKSSFNAIDGKIETKNQQSNTGPNWTFPQKSVNMFQKKVQPLIVNASNAENKSNKIQQQTIKKNNIKAPEIFDNFATLKPRNNTTDPKKDAETLKKQEGRRTNYAANNNQKKRPQSSSNTKNIINQNQYSGQNIEQQIKQDIARGRRITSKQQIRQLLVAQRSEIKNNLINLLKSQNKNVSLKNHGEEHTALTKERVDMIRTNNLALQMFRDNLSSEIKSIQDKINQQEKLEVNYNIQIPNFGKIDYSMKSEDYLTQLYKLIPPEQLLKKHEQLSKLDDQIIKLEQQIKIIQQSFCNHESIVKEKRMCLLNVQYEIIDIFEEEVEFKVYCNQYLTKKIQDLQKKYRQLKQDVKLFRQKKEPKSRISFNSLIY